MNVMSDPEWSAEFNSILGSLFVFPALSNHLIRPRQHVRRNREADLFCGFQIDDQLKLELATRRAAKSIGMRL